MPGVFSRAPVVGFNMGDFTQEKVVSFTWHFSGFFRFKTVQYSCWIISGVRKVQGLRFSSNVEIVNQILATGMVLLLLLLNLLLVLSLRAKMGCRAWMGPRVSERKLL